MLGFIRQKNDLLPENLKIITSNFSWLFFLRVLQKSLSLVSMYFVIRAIDQEMYGQYQFIISVIAVLSVFTLSETNNAIIQSVARGHLGIFRKMIPYVFFSSVLGSLVLFGVAVWYEFEKNNHHMAIGFLISSVFFPFAKGLTQWSAFKQGSRKFSSLVRWDGGVAILLQVTVVVGVIFVPATFLVPLVCILLVPAIQNIYLTWHTYKLVDPGASIENGIFSYGIRSSFIKLPVILSMYSEKILLFVFLSPETLALFVVAEKIPDLFKNLVQDISAALAPHFALYDRYTVSLSKYFKWFSATMVFLILFVAFVLLPKFFVPLFGEVYRDAIPYAIALMCSVAIGTIATIRARFIRSQLDSISLREIDFSMAIVRILSAAVLVPLFGLTGAVLSVFITRLFALLIVRIIMRKRYSLEGEI